MIQTRGNYMNERKIDFKPTLAVTCIYVAVKFSPTNTKFEELRFEKSRSEESALVTSKLEPVADKLRLDESELAMSGIVPKSTTSSP